MSTRILEEGGASSQMKYKWKRICFLLGFPSGTTVKNPSAIAGDTGDSGSIPGSGRSPGGENDNLLQYSCLENSMDRGDWWATVHGLQRVRHD